MIKLINYVQVLQIPVVIFRFPTEPSAFIGFLIRLNFINRSVLTCNPSQDGRNSDRGSKNKKHDPKNLFHGISPKTFIQYEKYVTRYVTTQAFRMWLTTFSPLIFGWTTK